MKKTHLVFFKSNDAVENRSGKLLLLLLLLFLVDVDFLNILLKL
jgi:hypothetical protein